MTTKKISRAQDVDAYLRALPGGIRARLKKLRQIIKQAAPEANEVMSYGMPAFKFRGMLAWYAACKHHYALYMRPKFLRPFKDGLKPYLSSKSTLRFSPEKPPPARLVTKIIRYAAKANLKKTRLRSKRKK